MKVSMSNPLAPPLRPEHNFRQQKRRILFNHILADVNIKYGAEPRRARRGIARTLMHKEWQRINQGGQI